MFSMFLRSLDDDTEEGPMEPSELPHSELGDPAHLSDVWFRPAADMAAASYGELLDSGDLPSEVAPGTVSGDAPGTASGEAPGTTVRGAAVVAAEAGMPPTERGGSG